MISRRAMLIAALGVPTGGFLGAGAYRANRATPSIRIIGNRDGMIVMLETHAERLLLLAGEVDEYLWRHHTNLTTIGRRRIDLLVGTYQTLLTAGVDELPTRSDSVVLSLQRDASLPPLRGNMTVISDHLEMRIGDDALLTIEVIAALENDAHPRFLATYTAEGTTSVIASSGAAVSRSPVAGINALIVPGTVEESVLIAARPTVLVTTVTDGPRGSWMVVPVYTDRATKLRLAKGAVHVDTDQVLS